MGLKYIGNIIVRVCLFAHRAWNRRGLVRDRPRPYLLPSDARGGLIGAAARRNGTVGIITMIVIGVVAGLIARAIVPGRQSMGVLATILLGIVGSFVGGLLGSLFSRDGNLVDLRPSGLLWSIIGAVVVLLLVGFAGRRRAV